MLLILRVRKWIETEYNIHRFARKPLSQCCFMEDYLELEESSKLKIDFKFLLSLHVIKGKKGVVLFPSPYPRTVLAGILWFDNFQKNIRPPAV